MAQRIAIILPFAGFFYLIPGFYFLFARVHPSLLQRIMGGICMVCWCSTLWRAVYVWNTDFYSFFATPIPHTGSFVLSILWLFVGSMGYIMIKMEHANHKIAKLANMDFLTSLYNRRAFYRFARKHFAFAARKNKALALLVVDIDHFKGINDQYGHQAGDKALKEIAALLKNHCRRHDVVGRFGGEEFVILLPDTSLEQAMDMAQRLRQTVESAALEGLPDRRLTVSIGVAALDAQSIGRYSLDGLLGLSDNAMYQAKLNGRNRVEWAAPDSEKAV